MTIEFFKSIGEKLLEEPALKAKRLPTLYPSAASCRSDSNFGTISIGDVQGACNRAQWYRIKEYTESDPAGLYSQYIFAAGVMWEKWIIEQTKLNGWYYTSNYKWSIPEYYLSGEIDIAIRDPETHEIIIVESKTYSSANYQAKIDLLGMPARGGATRVPMPKVQNVLQAALYLYYFGKPENGGVKRVLLTYFDRSCGGPENNQEFWISFNPESEGVTRIHIDCKDIKGNSHSYDMPGVSIEGVFARYKELLDHLVSGAEEAPKPDYEHVYNDEKVIRLYEASEIAETKYKAWSKDKVKNPIGDWQCSYCNYKTLCKQQKEEEGYN